MKTNLRCWSHSSTLGLQNQISLMPFATLIFSVLNWERHLDEVSKTAIQLLLPKTLDTKEEGNTALTRSSSLEVFLVDSSLLCWLCSNRSFYRMWVKSLNSYHLDEVKQLNRRAYLIKTMAVQLHQFNTNLLTHDPHRWISLVPFEFWWIDLNKFVPHNRGRRLVTVSLGTCWRLAPFVLALFLSMLFSFSLCWPAVSTVAVWSVRCWVVALEVSVGFTTKAPARWGRMVMVVSFVCFRADAVVDFFELFTDLLPQSTLRQQHYCRLYFVIPQHVRLMIMRLWLVVQSSHYTRYNIEVKWQRWVVSPFFL